MNYPLMLPHHGTPHVTFVSIPTLSSKEVLILQELVPAVNYI
jgi:hypothetical protein